MFTFILVLFLGGNPNLANKPTFTFLAPFSSMSQCQEAAEKAKEAFEKEEDKKRIGCIVVASPQAVREI